MKVWQSLFIIVVDFFNLFGIRILNGSDCYEVLCIFFNVLFGLYIFQKRVNFKLVEETFNYGIRVFLEVQGVEGRRVQ